MTTREREVHKFVHFGKPAAREALRDGPTGADRARDVVSLRRRLRFAIHSVVPGGGPQPAPAIAEARW